MSACMARRLRSRQTIWKLGSRPSWIRIRQAAQLDMRTTAVWLSVMLTASTIPFEMRRFFSDFLGVGAPGWSQFTGKCKMTGL